MLLKLNGALHNRTDNVLCVQFVHSPRIAMIILVHFSRVYSAMQ